jgi:hypothetical protein
MTLDKLWDDFALTTLFKDLMLGGFGYLREPQNQNPTHFEDSCERKVIQQST